MTSHHDPDEEATMPSRTMPADRTEALPRPRLRHADLTSGLDEPTRLDVRAMYEVPDPTAVAPARPVHVSPIGTHTQGAPAAVDKLNALLDERDRREGERSTRGGILRRRTRKALTVRQEADLRAVARMRHERHMETLEAIRAYLAMVCLVILFLLVVGMAAVAFAILAGYMTWAPTRA